MWHNRSMAGVKSRKRDRIFATCYNWLFVVVLFKQVHRPTHVEIHFSIRKIYMGRVGNHSNKIRFRLCWVGKWSVFLLQNTMLTGEKWRWTFDIAVAMLSKNRPTICGIVQSLFISRFFNVKYVLFALIFKQIDRQTRDWNDFHFRWFLNWSCSAHQSIDTKLLRRSDLDSKRRK